MPTRAELRTEKWAEELAAVFTDPIIVKANGWGDTLPELLRKAITVERLMANVGYVMTGHITATNAEAAAYLYTVSLEFPIDRDWSEIYLYVCTKVYEQHQKGQKVPEDVRVDQLTHQQQVELERLKDWIYRARVSHRRRNSHEPGKEVPRKEERAAPDVVQYGFELEKKP